MAKETIHVRLSQVEALVLYELLSRCYNRGGKLSIEDEAESAVLNSILCDLEKALAEPFSGKYDELLEEARKQVRSAWDGKAEGES
jgi:hypothetical protein